MSLYGVVDVGSNTVVLLVYEMVAGTPVNRKYISTPDHLIDEVHDGIMSEAGIEKAYQTLCGYEKILDEMHVEYRFADITEPCRIDNKDALIERLSTLSFQIYPLTGEEEARYDFDGSRLSWPDVEEGIAFDIGGGSTELISFKDGEAAAAMSFPLGSIRLGHLPLDTGKCEAAVLKARSEYPSLDTDCKELIGIGGTVRAVALVIDDLFHTGKIIYTKDLKEFFLKLRNNDETTVRSLKAKVDPARQPYILPGTHMMIVLTEIYNAELIKVSATGIREGFLLARLKELSKQTV